MLTRRRCIPPEAKTQWDGKLNNALIAWVEKNKPESIHCYLPMAEEIDLIEFLSYCLKKKLLVIAPKVKRKPYLEHLVLSDLEQLESGPMGTRHPKNAEIYSGQIDLIVVPGLAFDPQGTRIGYGGAFYDHFLVNHPRAYKLALCYPFQLHSELPREKHDIAVNHILCPQSNNKFKFKWDKVSLL
jgi:5-formyltetrahydrofolate cyclo-ligase